MKKPQKSSTCASALQITLPTALIALSAILLASSFKAAPAANGLSAATAPGGGGDKDLAIAGQASVLSLSSPLDAPFTFTGTGSLNTGRNFHTATLLPNGKVLVAGGFGNSGALSSAELYDPASGSWSATGNLNTARYFHAATLLPNGKVLVTGGFANSGALSSAELYDPTSGTWTDTGNLNTARYFLTATLLPNGKVLVAGGTGDGFNGLTSAELYDPASGTWTATGSLNTARDGHTATLLPNGKVLVAGGQGTGGVYLSSAELYDPASRTWTATGSLNTARVYHTATLLPNGKVLVAGGEGTGVFSSAELYDPASRTWTATGSLNTARVYHTAALLPNGKVLVAGGEGGAVLTSAELYDPASGSWSTTGSLNTARYAHTATLLPNGKVLVAGGYGAGYLTSAELFDPASGTWTATGSLNTARSEHTATLLPNGKVLVAGGYGNGNLTSAELYDPAGGGWTATGSLNAARDFHTATLLPNGKVLVAGGFGNSGALSSAELYDPATGIWTATGSLGTARGYHTATLLPNGKVLVAGGYNGVYLASAEFYDPATGTWTATGSLGTARVYHTATLLPNGKVLVAGGSLFGSSLASAELYDPTTGAWSATGSLSASRDSHTATLLPNGKVLVAGGNNGGYLASAELYDPATGTWTATGSLNTARVYHTATLLPNGKVLVAAGQGLSSAELYDPASGNWTATGSLNAARSFHTATLLPNGKVLVPAGENGLTSAELYDVGLGFMRPDWQPQIATATSPLAFGSNLMLTGSRFKGISQASGGNFQDSSTNYPVVQLRDIDNSQVVFLRVDPTAGWSDTAFISTRVNNFPPGPALVTVFTNGIPSDSKYVLVSTPTQTAHPATLVTSSSFTANWSSVIGATGYRLDVSTNNSFSTYVTGYQNLNVGNVISRNVTGLNASTTYYYRVRAYNGSGTNGNSNTISVTTLTATGAPVGTTNAATNVASFSATLNGSIDPHGLTTSVHFQYGTTTSYGSMTSAQTKSGNTYQSVSANVSGLSASTTYHFRIVASNSAGTRYGSDRTFTTLSATGAPVVITNPATNVASFSATLNSSVDPHGLTTTIHFQYGTTTSYGLTTASQSKSGNTYQSVSANIGGLSASTTYHFRIVATNSAGTRYGSDRTFTTLSATGSPVVTTNAATHVTSSSATLNGSLDPHGLTTSVYFQYGTTTSYGHNTPIQSQTGNTYRNILASVSSLATHTSYHFRIVATNSSGPRYGSDRTFTTP